MRLQRFRNRQVAKVAQIGSDLIAQHFFESQTKKMWGVAAVASDQGVILYYSRRYDRAIEQFRAVLDMDTGFSRAGMMTQAYVEKGLFKDALAFMESRRRLAEDGPWTWGTLAYVYGRAGQPVQARRALAKLEGLNRHQQLDPGPFLAAYVGMGDKELAFAWLEKAYLQHSNVLVALKVEPSYDFLRGDPRFQDLMRRVRLAP